MIQYSCVWWAADLWFLTAPSAFLGPALSAAVSSSLSQNIAEVVGQGGAAPLTSLQIHFIQNMIHETLEDFRFIPDLQLQQIW